MAKAYPAEVKAAVLADLAAGDSPRKVAGRHGIPEKLLYVWRKDARAVAIVPPEKRAPLDELVANAVRDTITALSVLARAVTDEAWIRQQPAGEIAVLYGVLADKTVRILAAAERAGSSDIIDVG